MQIPAKLKNKALMLTPVFELFVTFVSQILLQDSVAIPQRLTILLSDGQFFQVSLNASLSAGQRLSL